MCELLWSSRVLELNYTRSRISELLFLNYLIRILTQMLELCLPVIKVYRRAIHPLPGIMDQYLLNKDWGLRNHKQLYLLRYPQSKSSQFLYATIQDNRKFQKNLKKLLYIINFRLIIFINYLIIVKIYLTYINFMK